MFSGLLDAIEKHDLNTFKYLLQVPELGVNWKDSWGRTPLFEVTRGGRLEMMKVLYQTRPDLNPNLKNVEGKTALQVSLQNFFEKEEAQDRQEDEDCIEALLGCR